jgi:hypothetical protein
MSFARRSLIAFGIGFVVPIVMAIAYWSFFEHRPSKFAQVAELIGYLVCPPALLRIDFAAYPVLNGTLYLLVFSLLWALKASFGPKGSRG